MTQPAELHPFHTVTTAQANEILLEADHGYSADVDPVDPRTTGVEKTVVVQINGEQHLDVLEALLVLQMHRCGMTAADVPLYARHTTLLVEHPDETDQRSPEYGLSPRVLMGHVLTASNYGGHYFGMSRGKNGRVWVDDLNLTLVGLEALCAAVRHFAGKNATGARELIETWRGLEEDVTSTEGT